MPSDVRYRTIRGSMHTDDTLFGCRWL
jgi:hypothetical protein